MRDNLDFILGKTAGFEGGYSNHPSDPGGPTKFGVTMAVLKSWRKTPVGIPEVQALTKGEAREIFVANYWNRCAADKLDPGMDLLIFDMSINAGVSRAVKIAQKLVGVDPDGQIGTLTIDAIHKEYMRDSVALIKAYTAARIRFYESLKTWAKFGRGWRLRSDGFDIKVGRKTQVGMLDYALQLEKRRYKAGPPPMPVDAEPPEEVESRSEDMINPKADERDTAPTATTKGKAGVGGFFATIATMAATAMEKLSPYAETFKWIGYACTACVVIAVGYMAYSTFLNPPKEGEE